MDTTSDQSLAGSDDRRGRARRCWPATRPTWRCGDPAAGIRSPASGASPRRSSARVRADAPAGRCGGGARRSRRDRAELLARSRAARAGARGADLGGAGRTLAAREALSVADLIERDDLDEARVRLRALCGRDARRARRTGLCRASWSRSRRTRATPSSARCFGARSPARPASRPTGRRTRSTRCSATAASATRSSAGRRPARRRDELAGGPPDGGARLRCRRRSSAARRATLRDGPPRRRRPPEPERGPGRGGVRRGARRPSAGRSLRRPRRAAPAARRRPRPEVATSAARRACRWSSATAAAAAARSRGRRTGERGAHDEGRAARLRDALGRRQVGGHGGDLPLAAPQGRQRGAVQGAEHVAEFGGDPRRRRGRPRAGGAGAAAGWSRRRR